MGKYLIEVELEYGNFKTTSDSYAEVKDKFTKVKKQFSGTPCTIHVYNTETNKEMWAPSKPALDCIDRWNIMIDAIYDYQAAQIEMTKRHKELEKLVQDKQDKKNRHDIYHELETMDISEMNPEQIIAWVESKKIGLNKRRMVKKELARFAITQSCINDILDILLKNNGFIDSYMHNADKKSKQAKPRKYDLKTIESLYK